ncbi:MAG: ATP-binding protein [Alkalispirochaeta sp.]
MTKTELFELTANGENSGLEFKRDDVRPEQLAQEIVAMANVAGGRILLGVEDDGTISGITRPDLETWLMDTVFGRYVHPTIIPFYETVEIDPKRRVAVITITQGSAKPYVVRKSDREDVYIRLGTTSRLASREQQMRLLQQGGLVHTETLPVSGADLSSLDVQRIEFYLREIVGDEEIPASEPDWIRRLIGLGMMVEDYVGGPVSTIAGQVLFGRRPRRYLRQAGLRLLAFPGDDRGYETRLDHLIDQPATGDNEGNGLFEEAGRLLRPLLLSGAASNINESMRREDRLTYPWEAVRELVVNAVAHRDWTRSVDIEISLFADRIEIISPGALQNSMTVEKMIAGQRSPRNPLIVDTLRDFRYVESRGMGIRTKVIPLMRDHNDTEPQFDATDDYLKCTLYANQTGENR